MCPQVARPGAASAGGGVEAAEGPVLVWRGAQTTLPLLLLPDLPTGSCGHWLPASFLHLLAMGTYLWTLRFEMESNGLNAVKNKSTCHWGCECACWGVRGSIHEGGPLPWWEAEGSGPGRDTLAGGSWCSRLPAGLSVLAGSHGFGPGTPGWAHGPLCPPPPCSPVQQGVSPMEGTSPSAWALALTPCSLGLWFFTVRRVGRVSTWFPGEMGSRGSLALRVGHVRSLGSARCLFGPWGLGWGTAGTAGRGL